MNKSQIELTPQTHYLIAAAADFSRFNQHVLVDYYQPLMSPSSVGLFLTLKEQLQPWPDFKMSKPISSLLPQLNCGMTALRESLGQLEAVGLVKRFEDVHHHPGLLVFELQATMIPAEVLQDSLLSVQLLQMVGPDRFKELSKKAVAHQADLSSFENISQGFFDVYQPAGSGDMVIDPLINQARERITKYNRGRVDNRALTTDDFDFHFLAQQLAGQGIDSDVIQSQRQLIISEHLTYGFDELAIAKLMVRAVDLGSNQFDSEKFKLIAREVGADKGTTNKQTSPVSSNELTDFDEAEQLLIKQCEQLTPINFLRELKKQIHAYVSPNEQRIVERLVNQSGLGRGAINVLLWYIIADRENANINSSLADAIANSWSAAGVKNAADALKAAQQFKNKNAQRSGRRYTNYRQGKRSRDEQLPQWAQKGYQEKHEQTSEEDAAASEKVIAKGRQHNHQKGGGR